MPIINIAVKNKIASGDDTVIVCGNSDYVVRFAFDEEWQDFATKTMVVKYGNEYQEVVFAGCEAQLPEIKRQLSISIGVYAGDIHTTTAARFACLCSIRCGADTHAEPAEDVYNQIVALIEAGAVKGDTGNGIKYIAFTRVGENGENIYTVEMTDGTIYEVAAPKGDKGDKGDTYELTEQDKRDIAKLAETDDKVDVLWELNRGVTYDVVSDNTDGYIKTVPAGGKYAAVECIGGKTVTWNQLAEYKTTQTTNGVAIVNHGSYISLSGTALETPYHGQFEITSEPIRMLRDGTAYLINFSGNGEHKIGVVGYGNASATPFIFSQTGQEPWTNGGLYLSLSAGDTLDIEHLQFAVVDLTKLFNSGNEPTTVDDERIAWVKRYAEAHPEYNVGEFVNADVESVKYNNAVVGVIPAAVRNLTGYGWAIGKLYNSVEKTATGWQYVQKVGGVDLGDLDWTYNNSGSAQPTFVTQGIAGIVKKPQNNSYAIPCKTSVGYRNTTASNLTYGNKPDQSCAVYNSGGVAIADSTYTDAVTFKSAMTGVMLYFELAEPIVTDITDLMADFPDSFPVEADHTILLENGGQLSVPNTIKYLTKTTVETVINQKTAECVAATEKCKMVTESVLTKFSTFADVQRITRLGYHNDLIPVGDQFVVNRVKEMAISVGTSTGITSATVNPQTFIEKVGDVCNGQCKLTYDGDVWHNADNSVVVLSDYGVTVVGTPVAGDYIVITATADALTFDVLDHDKHTPADTGLTHSLALGMHDIAVCDKIPFSVPQLMYWSKHGLPAGTYKLTLDHAAYNGQTYYDGTYMFTLEKAIPADGGFRHTSPIGDWRSSWTQAGVIGNYITTYGARPHRDVIESGVTFLAYDGETDCTDLGTFTANSRDFYTEDDTVNDGKRNYTERQARGSNRWRDSVYRQYLNSTAPAGTTGNGVSNWWTPQNVFDMPPEGADIAGFLYGLDPSFVATLSKVQVITRLCSYDRVDGATQDITYDKVWLQSVTEVFGKANWDVNEGVYLAYWAGTTDADHIKYYNGTARHWWLRSPYPSISCSAQTVTPSDGKLNSSRTTGTIGIVPACCIV